MNTTTKEFSTSTEEILGRTILKICLNINNLPIIAASYSVGAGKVKSRLHHECFMGMPEGTIQTLLIELNQKAKGSH